jgi:hypothetical protein
VSGDDRPAGAIANVSLFCTYDRRLQVQVRRGSAWGEYIVQLGSQADPIDVQASLFGTAAQLEAVLDQVREQMAALVAETPAERGQSEPVS